MFSVKIPGFWGHEQPGQFFFRKLGFDPPPLNMHVITFGQTKPGGTMLAKRIKNATTRWMNRYMISKVNFRPNLNVSSSFSIFLRRIENCADPSTQLPQDTSRFTHVDDSLLIYPANMAWKSNSVVTRRLFVASRRAAAAPRAATRRRVRRFSPRDNQFESDV